VTQFFYSPTPQELLEKLPCPIFCFVLFIYLPPADRHLIVFDLFPHSVAFLPREAAQLLQQLYFEMSPPNK